MEDDGFGLMAYFFKTQTLAVRDVKIKDGNRQFCALPYPRVLCHPGLEDKC